MAITKVSDLKLGDWAAPISTLPDVPTDTMGADELKERFDSNSNELKEKFNALADTLVSLGIDDTGVITQKNVYTKEETESMFDALNTNLDSNYYTIEQADAAAEALYVKKDKHALDLAGKADLENGKIPANQLPSYVDDVIEGYLDSAGADVDVFPEAGEGGKIYVDIPTNKCYRWSGSRYTEISSSLALGTTESTAYPGNLGFQTASAVIGLNSDLIGLTTRVNDLTGEVGEVSGALDELHTYADTLISGGGSI